MDKWADWLTKPSPGEEVPNIYCLVSVLPGTKENYGRPYPGIKSWAHPVKVLMDLLKNRYNLKWSLVFSPYHWTNEVKLFSRSNNI